MADTVVKFKRKTAGHDTRCESCDRSLDLDKDKYSFSFEDGSILCAPCYFEYTGKRL